MAPKGQTGPKISKKYQEDSRVITYDDQSDNELPDMEEDINVAGKSLKNTLKDSDYIRKQEKESLPMGTIINDILSKDLTQRKYKSTIFTDKKQIVKTVTKTQKQAKLLAIKRHLKKKEENIGRTLPNKDNQTNYERALKIVAVEGITKMFNAMANIQKQSLNEVLKMSMDDKIGAAAAKKNARKRIKKGGSKGGKGGQFLNKKF